VGTGPQPTDGEAAAADGAVTASGTGRILPNTVYRATADIGSKLVSVAFYVVMARELGNSAFGVFTFGISFAALVTVLAGLGQDAILTREVAQDRRLVDRFFTNTVGLKVAVAAPVLLVAGAGLAITGVSGRTFVVTMLLSTAVLIELVTGTCFAVLQAYERLGYLPVVIIFQRIITAGAGIAVMAAGAGVEVVAAVYLAGALLAFGLALVLQFRYVVRPRLAIDLSIWWPLMRVALPVGLALIFQLTLFRVDIVILEIFAPERVVGQYGAAYRLFESTLFLSWAVGAALYPVLARIAGQKDATLEVFQRGIKLLVAVTLPLSLGTLILAKPVVELLYGSGFSLSVRALQLLAFGIVLCSINHVTGVLLLANHRERTISVVYGMIALVNIAANLALIPVYSLNAAALNTTLSEVLLLVLMAAFLWRDGFVLDWMRIAGGPLVAALPAAAVMFALRGHLAAAVASGLVVFGAALAGAEQWFYPKDAGRMWRIVRGVRRSVLGSAE
jgi:O-antigen/teichoic acid export membrane protein